MQQKINSIKLLLHKVQIALRVLYKGVNNTFRLPIRNNNKRLLLSVYLQLETNRKSLQI